MDILLVDESKTMRIILQRAIKQAGYRKMVVEEAENGVQALQKLQGQSPRLILSDWDMPQMNGIELLWHIRSTKNSVPFGFVTAETSSKVKALALESGAHFLLTKPFTPDDIQDHLAPILG